MSAPEAGTSESNAAEAEAAEQARVEQSGCQRAVQSEQLHFTIGFNYHQKGEAEHGPGQQGAEEESSPASPITVNTMAQLLKRPFGDVLKEIAANLQVGTNAGGACTAVSIT